MDKIIYKSVKIQALRERVFKAFTDSEDLACWLTQKAEVEPRIGGKYELFWNPTNRENDSTIGCKILAFKANELINFEWKGASQFKDFMNTRKPLTNVTVIFSEFENETSVDLIHTGWSEGTEWDEARNFFEKAWEMSLRELGSYLSEKEAKKCCN